uniref:ATP synthase complex subunit 8 n=1 Tax=Chizuella bonneti TaxID=420882 RepID=A0A1Q1MPD8_9ORTH|nr:ATP synthase F0 subunit 8 [Metrioptera bonneti]AQM39957.1 ATP synthase F0 subunit 8 [Metrioptera bonneti]QHX99578.1 ATP synthase F0 subunit 8 [Metrioptera bonneti]
MPQMMPMNWLFLFLMFSASLILFAIMNYYIFNYKIPTPTDMPSLQPKSLIWKW